MTDLRRELRAAKEHLAAMEANTYARDRAKIAEEHGYGHLGKIRDEDEMRKHIQRLEQDLAELSVDPEELPDRPQPDKDS